MATTKCELDLFQRVYVPGTTKLEGFIVGRVESAEGPPMYSLSWTSPNGRGASGAFSEGEVVSANMHLFAQTELPPTDYRAVRFPNGDMTDKKRADWLREQAQKLRDAAKPWDRLAKLGFNDKRKPARKSKSKSKRR